MSAPSENVQTPTRRTCEVLDSGRSVGEPDMKRRSGDELDMKSESGGKSNMQSGFGGELDTHRSELQSWRVHQE